MQRGLAGAPVGENLHGSEESALPSHRSHQRQGHEVSRRSRKQSDGRAQECVESWVTGSRNREFRSCRCDVAAFVLALPPQLYARRQLPKRDFQMAFGVWMEPVTRRVHQEAQHDHIGPHQVPKDSVSRIMFCYCFCCVFMDLLYRADVQLWLEAFSL